MTTSRVPPIDPMQGGAPTARSIPVTREMEARALARHVQRTAPNRTLRLTPGQRRTVLAEKNKVRRQAAPHISNLDVRWVGGKAYSVCADCGSIVRVNKPVLGPLHFCVPAE